VKGLTVLPSANNCQDSIEKAQPVGAAIDKNQPEFLEWLRAVATSMHAELLQSELRVVDKMN